MNDLLAGLAVLLVGTEIAATVAHALHLPRSVGQIIAGLLLGPSVLGVIHDSETLALLGEVGAFVILAIAGLETSLAAMRTVGGAALAAAAGGVLIPFVAGILVALAFGLDQTSALFVGATLCATSVGITAAVLGELGLLRSRGGMTILAAAVIDDVMGLVVLGLVVSATTAGGNSVIGTLLPMGITLIGAAIATRWAGGHLDVVLRHLHVRGGGHAGVLGLIVAVGWLFQSVGGLAGITGAYVTGVVLAGSSLAPQLRERLVHAGEALFVPAFFVTIGLAADLRTVGPVLPLAGALLAVAVLGKVIGSGLGAAIGGLTGRESVLVGVGMIARGEVALVAATLGLRTHAISDGLYAAIVLMALATTILTPLGMAGWAQWTRQAATARPATRVPTGGPALNPVLQARGDAE